MTGSVNRRYPILSRRAFCGALGALVAAGGAAGAGEYCRERDPVTAPAGADGAAFGKSVATPLGARERRAPWGVHLEAPALYDARLIEALETEKPRFLAIGSAFKFGSLHPQRVACETIVDGVPRSTFIECDDIAAVAARLDIPLRGDCLFWNDWLPAWIKSLAETQPPRWRESLQEAFEAHAVAVFDHVAALDMKYGRRMMPWCCPVNEPFEPWGARFGRPAWRSGAWSQAFDPTSSGAPGYIFKAFEVAERCAGPMRPALFLNEAWCESDRFGPVLRPAMLRLVDELQLAGRKIDAVGLEAHLMPQWMSDPMRPDWSALAAFIKQLTSRGLAVYVTELDVNDCFLQEAQPRDALVAQYTESFVTRAVDAGASMVTSWDFADRYAWLRDASGPGATYPTLAKWASCGARTPACPRPTPYDADLRPKSARDALARALSRRD